MALLGPINLVAVHYSTTRIDLTWHNQQIYDGTVCVEKKLVGGVWAEHTQVDDAQESYSVTGLNVGERYYFRVRALCGSLYSSYSNECDEATVLPPLTGFSATKDPVAPFMYINLAWTNNNSAYYSSIKIERKIGGVGTWVQIASIGHTSTGYYDVTVVPETEYWYRIRGYRQAPHYVYSAYTAENQAITEAIDPPTGLSAGSDSFIHIDLTWANHEDYWGMILGAKRLDPDGSWGQWEFVDFPVSHIFTNVQTGCRYRFRIRGHFTIEGIRYYSAYSNETDGATLLYAPNNLQSAQTGYKKITLTWDQSSFGSYRTDYDYVEISRSVNDGAWTSLGCIVNGFDALTWVDNNVEHGQKYAYRIRNSRGFYDPILSTWSTTTTQIIGFPSPSNLQASCLSPTSVKLDWIDNSSDEDGFKIYRDGALVQTVGTNVQTWTDNTVSASCWYSYYVVAYNALATSAPSNTVSIYTAYTPIAPSLLTALTVSASQINLAWQDNSVYEVDYHIEESANGVDYTDIAQVLANVVEYQRTGLGSDVLRYYRVRAHNTAGYSAYSNVATARTLAAIGQPTGLGGFPLSGTEIYLTFTDNSSDEDGHKLERSPYGGGSYVVIATLAPNVCYYKDSGLDPNTPYVYRIRAYQGAQYSDYSNEDNVSTYDVPAAPTNLAIAETTDTTQKLTWTASAVTSGYKIEKSLNGSAYTEIMIVEAGVLYFTVRDLTPNTRYWYKIRSYNPTGNSSYTSPVDGYTSTEYTPTDFEKLIRQPVFTPILLAEINPKKTITGWSLVGGQTYTYIHVLNELRIDLEYLWENGTSLTKKTTIAAVEAAAGSWYFDFGGRNLYVHTSTGANADNFFIEASFWLYFTNYQDGTIVFNDHNYLPFLKLEDIPSVSHEIKPTYEGDFSVSAGQISIMSRESPAEGYTWDRKYSTYTFENRPLILKFGTIGWIYEKFKSIFAGMMDKVLCKDTGITIGMIDAREGIHRTIPINKLWQSNYPLMDVSLEGTVIPILFGTKANCSMYCIDAGRKIYKYHDGRVKAVDAVKKNGITLAAGTDYYSNLVSGIITFDENLSVASTDELTVDFQGIVNSADELLTNGADIFMYIARNYWGLSVDELNLDSIYATKAAQTKVLSIYISREVSTSEILRTIEHSLRAYSFQDELGRIGLAMHATTAPSNIRYVGNHHISNFSMARDRASLYKTVRIYYAENPKTQDWAAKDATSARVGWAYRNNQILEFYTYLTTAADATALALAIQNDLNKISATFETSPILYGLLAGDVFYLSRERYFNEHGFASAKLMRIMKIDMNIASGRCQVTAVEI